MAAAAGAVAPVRGGGGNLGYKRPGVLAWGLGERLGYHTAAGVSMSRSSTAATVMAAKAEAVWERTCEERWRYIGVVERASLRGEGTTVEQGGSSAAGGSGGHAVGAGVSRRYSWRVWMRSGEGVWGIGVHAWVSVQHMGPMLHRGSRLRGPGHQGRIGAMRRRTGASLWIAGRSAA